MTGDWSVLGYDTHPIPGDPTQVALMSRYYSDVASAINETAANLRQITLSAEVQSEAVEAFSESARKVASSVNEIDDRYGVVASALQTYGGELDRVRRSAASELALAEHYKSDRTTARTKARQLEHQIADVSTPPANVAYLSHQLQGHYTEIATATTQISAAMTRVQNLVVERAAAAQAAAALIEDECRGSDLNDGTWDKVANFVSEVWNGVLDLLEDLVDLIDKILPILEILSFIVAIVMIVLICLGVGVIILAVIALVIAATSLLLNVIKLEAQVVLASNGRTTWAEVAHTAVDVGFAVVDVVLAATGLGELKAVAAGVEGAVAKTAKEAIFDYLVEDRLIDVIHDEGDILVDVVAGEGLPSATDVMRDVVFMGPEDQIFDATVEGLRFERDLVLDGVNNVYQTGSDIVDELRYAGDSVFGDFSVGELARVGG